MEANEDKFATQLHFHWLRWKESDNLPEIA